LNDPEAGIEINTHVLPTLQEEAAAKMNAILTR